MDNLMASSMARKTPMAFLMEPRASPKEFLTASTTGLMSKVGKLVLNTSEKNSV